MKDLEFEHDVAFQLYPLLISPLLMHPRYALSTTHKLALRNRDFKIANRMLQISHG